MRTPALAALCLGLLPGLLSAQTLVVDPGGGGNFTQLQPAINAAATGALILVRGGTYDPVTIDKSLTIVGEQRFEIYMFQHHGPCPSGLSGICQAAAVALAGTGSESLVLVNAKLHGWTPFPFNYSAPVLRNEGFAEVWLEDCELQNYGWHTLTGVASGNPAIAMDGGALWLIRSTAIAQPSDVDTCIDGYGKDGPEGIAAPASRVVLLDSTVVGGSGGTSCFHVSPPTATPCPCPNGTGVGGTGVVAGEVIAAGSVVAGGAGGDVVYMTLPGYVIHPWGRQPNGQAYLVNRKSDIVPSLTGGQAHIGQAWRIGHRGIGTNTIIVGLVSSMPWELFSYGWGFFEPTLPFFLASASTGATHSIPIPGDPNLIGLRLCAQHYEYWTASLMQPVLATIAP